MKNKRESCILTSVIRILPWEEGRVSGRPFYPCQQGRRPANLSRFHRRGRQRKEKVCEDRVGKAAVSGFGILRRRKTDPFRGPWKHPALKARLDIGFRGARVYITDRPENENGNSGSKALPSPSFWERVAKGHRFNPADRRAETGQGLQALIPQAPNQRLKPGLSPAPYDAPKGVPIRLPRHSTV